MTINNSDTVNIIGPSDLLEEEAVTSFVTAKDIFMRGKSMLSIDQHAGMDISGTTEAHTPSNSIGDRATIDVDGIFYSFSVKIRGNSHLAFVVTEDADVRASELDGTLEMNGNSTLTFTGDVYEAGGDADGESIIDIGGVMVTNGSGAQVTADDATVYTCHTFSNKVKKNELNNGKFEEGNCRTLPVLLLDLKVEFNPQKKQPKISWTTAKEWESSHFILERAINTIDQFEEIGSLKAIGFTEAATTYTFFDPGAFRPSSRIYYRLIQVSLDGSKQYSEVISLQLTGHSNDLWTAFPNPTNGSQLTLTRSSAPRGSSAERITLKLYIPGQLSWVITDTIPSSDNIDLSALINKAPKGLLILEIKQGNQIDRIKLINR
ncbi:hypothetical protein GCM10028791_32910 [Echinicola sediminis]